MKKCLIIPLVAYCGSAGAIDFDYGKFGTSISGYGSAGVFFSESREHIIPDFRLRATGKYNASDTTSFGIVYAIDDLAMESKHSYRDAFVYIQYDIYGRIEAGFTDSIAAKLAVGLPDVGGLRINEYSKLYKYVDISEPVISNMMTGGTRYAFRLSVSSVPAGNLQYGFSIAPPTDNFNYAADLGIKYRKPYGKTKIAASFGATFIENPTNLSADVYLPRVNAQSRTGLNIGANLQYNSWIFGIMARTIYDVNPNGPLSDGLAAGAGFSYDILNMSLSMSYMFSDIGTFQNTDINETVHTGIFSARYKFNKYIALWISGGTTYSNDWSPFMSAGLRVNF